jgi:hypothetical protein
VNEYEEGEEVAVETLDAPAAWDGAMDSLLTQPWVPEDARPHLEKHLTEHRDATTRRDFLDRVYASDDKTATLSQELATTRAELTSLKEALGKTEKERDEYKGKATTYETERSKAEEDKEFARLLETYPDLFTEDGDDEAKWHGAWREFYKLVEAGYSEDKAAKMARTMLPERPAAEPAAQAAPGAQPAAPAPPPTERKVTVPPSVAGASRSSASPSTTVNAAEANETFDQRVARMEAEEKAKQKLGVR